MSRQESNRRIRLMAIPMMVAVTLICLVAGAAGRVLSEDRHPLTADWIVTMSNHHVQEATILKAIHDHQGAYRLDQATMARLNANHVPDRVIEAMLSRMQQNTLASATPTVPAPTAR